MIIRRANIFTGRVRELELDVTQEQIKRWQNGELIQNAMPHLSADEREFLVSGMLPEEWDAYISDGEPEEEVMEDVVRDDFIYDV